MWEQIESNRRKSALVIAAMGVMLVGVGAALGLTLSGELPGAVLGGAVALAVWLALWLVTRWQGDDLLLQLAHAREIQKRDHPQLFNVVEEMSIAAALPQMPRVFIVDDPAPNAFAVGRDMQKSAVAVTLGLLQLLTRDELQGVVAHEIGHIKNRDVALMTTAGIMLGTIVILADLGVRALWWGGGRRARDSENGGGGAQAILLIVALVFMVLSPLLAQLIYFALSRRREYLADASGAMYSRWPEGLASALEKLGQYGRPQSDQNHVTAPMYIVRPLRAGERRNLSSAFSTHPPLDRRIRVLRGMGSQADLAAYDQSYAQLHGRHVIGARSLQAAQPMVSQAPESTPTEAPRPERLREASNAYLAGAGYRTLPCPQCGVKIKIPPQLRRPLEACPRCHAPLAG